jgi:hypothetical protein
MNVYIIEDTDVSESTQDHVMQQDSQAVEQGNHQSAKVIIDIPVTINAIDDIEVTLRREAAKGLTKNHKALPFRWSVI